LPGVVGFHGIGHFYLGRIRRGLILLIGAWVLIFTAVFSLIAWSMCQMVIPPPGQPMGEPPAYIWVFLVISPISFLGAIALWIWQIFDAKTACQNYNKQVSN